VLRENSVPIDFIGFLGSLAPCFRHEDPARGAGHTVSQSDRLHMVQPDGWYPDSRAQTAARRVQAQVEETDDKKPGSDGGRESFENFGEKSHRGNRADAQYRLSTLASSNGYLPILRSMVKIASPWSWRSSLAFDMPARPYEDTWSKGVRDQPIPKPGEAF